LAVDMHHVCPDGRSYTGCLYEDVYRADPRSVGLTQRPNSRGRIKDTLFFCQDEQKLEADLQRMPCEGWNRQVGSAGFYSASPRSLHPGGVNAAYLDGHIEFVSDDVDDFAFAYAVSINDGQTQFSTP